MDKTELYTILDVSNAEEFHYYENIASLLEEDQLIEENLLIDLLSEVDMEGFQTLMESYFKEFIEKLPDEEVDLFVMAETMQRVLTNIDDPRELAEAIYTFRKWYVIDTPVIDKNTGAELNVRDARYNILAAKYTGEEPKYDFNRAYNNEMDGYDVRVKDMFEDDLAGDDEI